jgi:hypothetical protein
LSGASSCTAGAAPEIAARMSMTAGNSSISTPMASAASRASARLFATTAAIGSPTWRTLPLARIGCRGSFITSPFRLVICQPQGSPPTASKSAPVKMRSTPGIFEAAAVSTLTIFPCATVERRK